MSDPGVLREIALFPVKSVSGLTVTSCDVEAVGLVGDRGFAVVDAVGEVLRAKRVPRVAELTLSGPAGDPEVVVPGGLTFAEFLGVPGAHLVRVDGGARQVEAVHLVSRRQRDLPGAGDTSRANLVVDLPDEPPAERWVGLRCAVGAVELEVVGVPRHCGGVFARVLRTGEVHIGDAVRLSQGPLD